MEELLSVVYADGAGRLLVQDDLAALARLGTQTWQLEDEDVIPMPTGSNLMLLPDRSPVGIGTDDGEVQVLDGAAMGAAPMAVAAALPVGYTRTHLPAFEKALGARHLPLFGYTAVASRRGQICVAALRTDDPAKWVPEAQGDPLLRSRVEERLAADPDNRVLRQLAKCSLAYHCSTAQNIFYRRWEGGIPVSSSCNANCFGCISLQSSECCPSPQARIDFVPSVDEVVKVAAYHLDGAEDAIISFGQGCEGEPLTQHTLLARSIRGIRSHTQRGTINLNTNGGMPRALAPVIEAGLDSVRLSLFSPIPEEYALYHRPVGYCLADVVASMRLCASAGVSVSVNLLTFPGVTDDEERARALVMLLVEGGAELVQLRNLSLDPDLLFDELHIRQAEDPMGMRSLISFITDAVPGVRVGNYSRPTR